MISHAPNCGLDLISRERKPPKEIMGVYESWKVRDTEFRLMSSRCLVCHRTQLLSTLMPSCTFHMRSLARYLEYQIPSNLGAYYLSATESTAKDTCEGLAVTFNTFQGMCKTGFPPVCRVILEFVLRGIHKGWEAYEQTKLNLTDLRGDVSREEFGALLSLNGSTIGRWESKTCPPSAYHFYNCLKWNRARTLEILRRQPTDPPAVIELTGLGVSDE